MMNDKMFIAARLVKVPEGFPCDVFRLKAISRFFVPNHDLHASSLQIHFALVFRIVSRRGKIKREKDMPPGEIKLEKKLRKGIVPGSD